ncbi:hypothetical protein V501_07178 [Pseudogymnoascus sp. VKM F-4519 (FW-2642)]|nr:hypothetical protein V501_07178 [Pseudogymnoascus sp. VKM F-4519 (FW-2642)]
MAADKLCLESRYLVNYEVSLSLLGSIVPIPGPGPANAASWIYQWLGIRKRCGSYPTVCIDKANKNSGKWLLELSRYTDWFKESHSFLWLHGASGCGKSSLCSTVVKSLVGSAEKNSNMIVAYWYFDNADPPTQNLQQLLRLILRRISAKATPFPEAVRNLANNHELLGSSPSTVALIETLEKTVTALQEDVFLIIDAIVSVDVDAYLDATIGKYSETKHWSPETTDKIHRALKDDGRFRIISLQLDDLRKCFDGDEIDVALKSIPRDIEDAYLRKLQRVAPKDALRLSYIFYWISVAARQLTTFELAAAPGVNLFNPEELLNICPSSMIRIEKQKPSYANETDLQQQEAQKSLSTETGIITFDHPSVKRFLYSHALQQPSDNRVSRFFVSEEAVNATFMGLMIDYLLAMKQPKIEPSIFMENPLPYVAQHWHEHFKGYRNSPTEDVVLKDKMLTLFAEPMNPAFLNWIRVWNLDRKKQDFGLSQESCPSPLYVAIFLRFEDVSRHLIKNRSYINCSGGLMHTALQLASQQGCTEIVQGLIAAGEDVNNTIGDQPTALYTAVENGDAQLVQTLLTAGASPDAEHALLGPALQLASFREFARIVELLVASGADVNLQSIRFGTALQAAAAAGHGEIVAILLAKGSKPDAVGGLLGNAIQAATTAGHSFIVQMLAGKGIAWDEKRDSIWHEAFDLFVSRSPRTRAKFEQAYISKSLLSTEQPVGSDTQRMLAGILKMFSSPSTTNIAKAAKIDGEPSWFNNAQVIRSQKLLELANESQELQEHARRQGQEGMESKHYVYRALFWAMLFHCRTIDTPEMEILGMLSHTIALRAIDQKAIEHSTSDDVAAARHELVACYALAFGIVAETEWTKTNPMRTMAIPRIRFDIKEMVVGIQQQNKRVENLMKIVRLQEPSAEVVLLGQMHSELLAKMQKEMRGCFQTLEESMQKNLEEVEKRVVASVQDILPGIIREEMRKLLAEQKDLAAQA